jgi:hypothetical protein
MPAMEGRRCAWHAAAVRDRGSGETMRTTVALLLTLAIAPAAIASPLGDKIAREVCSYNRAYMMTTTEYAEFNSVNVTGGHQYDYNTERYFVHLLGAAAYCKESVRVGMFATCKTAPVIRSGDLLQNSGGWTDATC